MTLEERIDAARKDFLIGLRADTIRGQPLPQDRMRGAEEGWDACVDWFKTNVLQDTIQRDTQNACRHPNRVTTGWSPGSLEHFHCPDCDKRWSD